MIIDTKTVISMTEANQNFSKVARLVEQYGQAVVFKNNVPRYLVLDFSMVDKEADSSGDDLSVVLNKVVDGHDEIVSEQAKQET